jgi:hypothetical protein
MGVAASYAPSIEKGIKSGFSNSQCEFFVLTGVTFEQGSFYPRLSTEHQLYWIGDLLSTDALKSMAEQSSDLSEDDRKQFIARAEMLEQKGSKFFINSRERPDTFKPIKNGQYVIDKTGELAFELTSDGTPIFHKPYRANDGKVVHVQFGSRPQGTTQG